MSLDVSNPDRDSITVNATSLFLRDVDDGYQPAVGSSAAGLLPDGSCAGPYQYGNEIVGSLPGWPACDSSSLPSKPAAAAAPSGFTV